MIPKTITIALPAVPAIDAAVVGRRVSLFDYYIRAIKASMSLPHDEALNFAAAFAISHDQQHAAPADVAVADEFADKLADIALDFAELLRNFRDAERGLKNAVLFAAEAMSRDPRH
jgi:hypothetical protein